MSNYPIYKSCSFLAINYYEEISNTFEDCLSEAILPETTFLLSEDCSPLQNIDDFYRYPWKKVPYDKEFVLREANKAEESISEISQNCALTSNEPKWVLPDCATYSTKVVCEDVFSEKNLDIFRERILHGKFQFLDVPHIPFTLLKSKQRFPTLTVLLKKLPIMEIEDLFEFEDISFEDNDVFFVDVHSEEIKKSSENNYNITFEELTLKELPLEEISCFKNCIVTHTLNDNNEEKGLESKEFRRKQLDLSQNSPQNVSYNICNGSSNCHTVVKDIGELCENITPRNYDKYFENTSTESTDLVTSSPNNNTFCVADPTKKKLSINSNNSQQNFNYNINLDTSLNSDTQDMSHFIQNNVDEIFSTFANTSDSQNLEKNINFEGASFLDNSNSNKLCLFPLETFANFEFNKNSDLEEDNGTLNKENSSTLEINMIHPYLEKISNLHYKANINVTDCCKSLPAQTNTKLPKDFKSYTAVRRKTYSTSTLPSLPNEVVKEKTLNNCSQPLNQFQSVDLLSKFIQVQNNFQYPSKLCNEKENSGQRSPKASFSSQIFATSRLQKEYGIVQKEEHLSASQKHPREESIPCITKLEVEDLLVKLPDDYIKLLLICEDAAIPLLQSLMLSDEFKFPPHFTLADIPSYQTCFLLNQEVKRCQDKNVNNGKIGDYYTCLLTLHGILKTMECFIHFDIHLGVSCLQEFAKCHKNIMKGYYGKLIEKLDNEADKLFENNYVHPKVKELSIYVKEKYKFCEENEQKFKALIILKRNLEIIYSTFETVLKKDLTCVRIYLIPENLFLHEKTLIFKSTEDTVYFINASSLSKHIPWIDLSLVIEFEPDNNTCWKQICSEQNIPHAFVKVATFSLKSLEEIQKSRAIENCCEENVRLLIVSASVTSQYQLLYLLESKLDFSICIRHYKEILPHLHFADIVVDEKSAIILVSDVSFLVEDFSEMLSDRVSFMHIKYEACWILIQEYKDNKNLDILKQKKLNGNYLKLYLSSSDLCQRVGSYEIKILHVHSIEETADLIRNISSVSSRSGANMNNMIKMSASSQITKEEIFLASFPSLNPFVVQVMLSECNLYGLLNLTGDELSRKFHYVPERFLKCFYSTIHNVFTSSANESEEYSESSENSSHESNVNFQFEPNFPITINQSPHLTYLDQDIPEDNLCNMETSFQPKSRIKHSWDNDSLAIPPSPEMSLQELDLDYMSLKLSNKYDEYQGNRYDESSCDEEDNQLKNEIPNAVENPILASAKDKKQIDNSEYTFESLSSQISDRNSNSSCEMKEKNNYGYKSFVGTECTTFLPSGNEMNLEHEVPCSLGWNTQKSQTFENRSILDFQQFTYTPRQKRKLSIDDCSCINESTSSLMKKSCRIQKGMTSKTVCKQNLIYHSPFNTQGIPPSQSTRIKEARVLPFMVRKRNCAPSDDFCKISQLSEDKDIFKMHELSQWSDSSVPLKSIPLTPTVTRRLGYEKMPGLRGQTRLVFQ